MSPSPCPAPRRRASRARGRCCSRVEHRGDQPQPRQVGVVEQRDPADPQRRMKQPPVAVHPDVAGGGARQPRQLVDAVLAGCRDAVRLLRRVEQLRHRVLDDVARATANVPGCAPQPVEDRRDRARWLPRRSGGRHVRPTSVTATRLRVCAPRPVVAEPEVPHLSKILRGEARVHRRVETVRRQVPAAAARHPGRLGRARFWMRGCSARCTSARTSR